MSRPPSQGSQRYGEENQARGPDGYSGRTDNSWSANRPPPGQHQGYRQQGSSPYNDHSYRAIGPEGAYSTRQHDSRHYPQHPPPPQHYQQQNHHQYHHQAQQYPHPHGPQSPPPIRLVPGQPPPFPIQSMQQHQHSNNTHFQDSRNYSNQHHRHHNQQRSQETFSEHQFPVYPLDRFKVKCAPFRQPIEIGSFSYDKKRNFIMDDSQLKYYFPPDLTKPNNLSVNYDKYISRDLTVDEHVDALLDALICIRDREQQQKQQEQQETTSVTQADFICYRGLLTKIMCTPYVRNEPWEMGATLYKGSIYIEEHVSAERRENAAGSNDRHKLMSYWGYRFETICNISKPVSELRKIRTRKRGASPSSSLIDNSNPQRKVAKLEDGDDQQQREEQTGDDDVVRDPNNIKVVVNVDEKKEEKKVDELAVAMLDQIDLEDPELTGRLDGIVDTNLQYCTVARTKIGKNSIIMGAEVDCTSEPKKAPPHNPLSNYIELKTSRVISSAREQNNFERYVPKSFLPGIPTIIVGFRDDDGNVVTVETFKTMEIPRLVRGKEGAWDTTICINFLDGVLNFLREQITIDDPEVSYTIRWAPPYKAIKVEYIGKGTSFLTERFLKSKNKS
ncbi:decapping endonuclease targeting mRNA [Linnemannia schmuckeri]|uniref:Decapping nuclease n=1 Tax=Linnemannia schmuckeri TaxID=64567 RepID=A0A9P5VEQ8_9FUNG|nr:decapping endonuclease targeting mRNA [Linnemannia schmuckeri]